MRIVGGSLRGRTLAAPPDRRIRPTTDRVRESLYDLLAARLDFDDIRVIDCFAGTGALGLEALSRGASFVLFVEHSSQSRALVRTNVERLGMDGKCRLYRRDASRLGGIGTVAPFDLALADPPYGQELGVKCALSLAAGGWLKPGGLLAIEEAAHSAPSQIEGYELAVQRRYGDIALTLYRFETAQT